VPVVISEDFALSSSVQEEFNANNPVIGWKNLARVDNIFADSEQSSFPAINLANPQTHSLWKSNSIGLQSLRIIHNSSDPIDYVAVAGHNFRTANIAVSLEGYTALTGGGDPDWFELSPSVIPDSSSAVLFRFNPRTLIGVRVVMQAGVAAPAAAVVYVGRLLVLQRRIYVGHKPMIFAGRVDNAIGRSDRGQFLGSVVLSAWNEGTLQQNNVEPDFYRAEVEPFRRDHVMARRSFFFAWRPGDYPQEVAYCWPNGDLDASNQLPNGMMQFSLAMQGIVS
jgi:hypothetical protein